MKKGNGIAAVALMALFAMSCSNSNKVELESEQDTMMADTSMLDTSKVDATITDTPALGTDNIRMDSMNNSKQ